MATKAAAWFVMADTYMKASSGGTLPANARQVMYAARGRILALTGKDKLDDNYFTQRLLPDYIAAHPEETADWDVVFDDRGALIEPHTGRVIPLGTVAVREYLGERPSPEKSATLDVGDGCPHTDRQADAIGSRARAGGARLRCLRLLDFRHAGQEQPPVLFQERGAHH
jgi:hypothetical protein